MIELKSETLKPLKLTNKQLPHWTLQLATTLDGWYWYYSAYVFPFHLDEILKPILMAILNSSITNCMSRQPLQTVWRHFQLQTPSSSLPTTPNMPSWSGIARRKRTKPISMPYFRSAFLEMTKSCSSTEKRSAFQTMWGLRARSGSHWQEMWP